MKLSFLDFGYVAAGKIKPHKVIENLFSMSSALEILDCHRFWLGEHYGVQNEVAWFSPRILLPLLLANTERMRIGSGGELMSYQIPLAVAHDYTLLSAIFSGRIDLGIVKGIQLPELIDKEFYQSDVGIKVFIEKIKKTVSFLQDDVSAEIRMPLLGTAKPPVWLLGPGRDSFEHVAKMKTNLSLALFHNPSLHSDKDILRDYKEIFLLQNGYMPETMLSIICYCVGSIKERDAMVKDMVKRYPKEKFKGGVIVDTPDNLYHRLEEVCEDFDTEEIMIHNDSVHLEEKNLILEFFKYAKDKRQSAEKAPEPLAAGIN